jgi:hypothetical protein
MPMDDCEERAGRVAARVFVHGSAARVRSARGASDV